MMIFADWIHEARYAFPQFSYCLMSMRCLSNSSAALSRSFHTVLYCLVLFLVLFYAFVVLNMMICLDTGPELSECATDCQARCESFIKHDECFIKPDEVCI